MKPNFKIIIFIVALLILNILFMKAQTSLGIFDNVSDIGNVKIKGSCFYDSLIEKYTVKGSGKNMWYNSDEFFFVWKKMKGDFILTTNLNWIGKGIEPHRKAGLIIRESLEPGSPYIDIANHGEGLISAQYRLEKDSVTKEIQCLAKSTPVMQIEKSGDTIYTRVAESGESLKKAGELKMHFNSDEYYVGLFICAHNVDVIEEANFLNTRLEIPAKKNFIPYQDYIGSRLEILDIETGLRKIIYQSSTPFEAPNWTKDGKLLI